MILLSHRSAARIAIAGVLASAFAVPASAQDLSAVPAGTYKNDPLHSYITFSYSHFGLSNPELAFDDVEVTLDLDPADPTASSVSVTIDTDSVVAGSELWHEHLTSADWFDSAKNPQITFESTSVETAGDDTYAVTGDLTLAGQTKPVTMNMTINAATNHPMSGDPVVGLGGSGEVLRSDFGLGKLAPDVSDKVTIDVTTEMLLQK